MVTIRQAQSSDAKAAANVLAVLHFGSYNDIFTAEKVLPYIQQGCVYLAVDESLPQQESVLGTMILLPDDVSYKIHALASRTDMRRNGIGTTLVEYVKQRCRDEGIPKIWAWSLDRYGLEGFAKAVGVSEAYRLQKQFFGEDCWFFGILI
jgi:N-acetylglutamate synthase-like GNAT family acetyltransferase